MHSVLKFLIVTTVACSVFLGGVHVGISVEQSITIDKITKVCAKEGILLDVPYKDRVLMYGCFYMGDREPRPENLI